MSSPTVAVAVQRFGPVVRVRLGRRLLGKVHQAVNVYWVDGLLIDSGAPHLTNGLLAALQQTSLPVEQLVNTHAHEDHIGGNATIGQEFGVNGQIHLLGLERAANPPHQLPLYRELIWGVPQPATVKAIGPTITTDRYRFQVIHTPGHAPDHIVLFEPEQGWLFSADLFLSPGITMIMDTERPLELLESMRRIVALPVRHMFCAHARDVHSDTAPLQEKVRRWDSYRLEAQQLAAAGWPERRIVRKLLGSFHPLELISRGEYHRRHLIRGLLGQEP